MFTVWRGWGAWGVEVGGSQEWKDVKCAQPPAEWKRKQDICFKGGVTKDKCGISKGWGNSHGLGSLYGNFITVIHTAFQWSRCFYVCSADFFFFFFPLTQPPALSAASLWIQSEDACRLQNTFFISIHLLWFCFPPRSSAVGTFDRWVLHHGVQATHLSWIFQSAWQRYIVTI